MTSGDSRAVSTTSLVTVLRLLISMMRCISANSPGTRKAGRSRPSRWC